MPVSIILWDEQLKAMVYLYTRLAEWHMLDFAQASLISAYLTPDRFKNIFTHRGPRWSPFLSVDQNSWEFMTGSVVALGGVLYIYIYITRLWRYFQFYILNHSTILRWSGNHWTIYHEAIHRVRIFRHCCLLENLTFQLPSLGPKARTNLLLFFGIGPGNLPSSVHNISIRIRESASS